VEENSLVMHFHKHKVASPTYIHAVLVEKNMDATPKQPIKNSLKQKSSPEHK